MYSQEQMLKVIQEKNVEFLRLQFTDISGIVKNVAIPATQMGKALKSGISFDGSSIEGFARIQESDMVLRPDLSTFSLLPWSNQDDTSEARLLCDLHLPNRLPFQVAPRRLLYLQLALAPSFASNIIVCP